MRAEVLMKRKMHFTRCAYADFIPARVLCRERSPSSLLRPLSAGGRGIRERMQVHTQHLRLGAGEPGPSAPTPPVWVVTGWHSSYARRPVGPSSGQTPWVTRQMGALGVGLPW